MIINKKTKNDIILLFNESINLLNDLQIDDKKKEKNIMQILENINNCKNTINNIKPIKRKPSGYNNFISDCCKLKKGEKTSGILNKTIEEILLDTLQKNEKERIFKSAGNFWKYELDKMDENAKNIYLGKKLNKHKSKKKNK